MDTAEVARHSVAAVEAAVYASEEPDEARAGRNPGLEECDKWKKRMVERRRIAYEPSVSQEIL